MKTKATIIRQGDVLLQPVASMPAGCIEVPLDRNRIVLAYGEVTGHAHAIADHTVDRERALNPALAEKLAANAIKRAATSSKARLLQAPNGDRFLEVKEAVNLTHEEHTAHTIPPGIYQAPRQVEYVAPELIRPVAD